MKDRILKILNDNYPGKKIKKYAKEMTFARRKSCNLMDGLNK